MPQNTQEPNPTSEKKADCPPNSSADDFDTRPDLDGKTDSGPEPDVMPVTKDL
jgi:hypothetical protein